MKNSESSFYFEYYDDIDFETKNEYLSRINCETNKLRFLFNISEPMALKFLFENKLNLEESISSLFKFFENNQTSFFSLKNYQIEEINDTCEICLDVCEKRISNNCGHFFCEKCYANFIEIFLETNGFEAIFAKCPEPSCEKILHPNLVEEVLKNRNILYEKYLKFFDICKLNQKYMPVSFCPVKDCQYVFPSQIHNSSVEELPLVCPNLHSFCGKCFGSLHKFFSCSSYLTFAAMTKNKTQKQNLDWFIRYTAKCPKCFVNIEKNDGCKHMTCRNCSHQFCWECLKDWVNHSDVVCTKILKEKQGRGGKREKATNEIKLFQKIIGLLIRITPKSSVAVKYRNKIKLDPTIAKIENQNNKFTEAKKSINKTKKDNINVAFLKRFEEKKKIPDKLDGFKLARFLIEIEEFLRIINLYKDKALEVEGKITGKPSTDELEKMKSLFTENLQRLVEGNSGWNLKHLMTLTLKIYRNFKEMMKEGLKLGWEYANDSQDIEL